MKSIYKKNIFFIFLLAIFLRLLFACGHVFSDDAYFTYLAYTLFDGNFAQNYIGYPVSPLRINIAAITALAYWLFGTTEFATMIFPFLFSMANLTLTFFMARLVFRRDDVATIAVLMMAVFPPDVIFATISFTDSPSAFLINLGLYLLLRAYLEKRFCFAVLAGLAFSFSLQFKVNIFFTILLLGLIWLYLFYRDKKPDGFIPLALSFVAINLLIEGYIYYQIHHDFFYRFTQMELNYHYGSNDHFTLGSRHGYASNPEYLSAVLKQVFWLNPRYIFLRRFYLFLPAMAMIESLLLVRKKDKILPAFWFSGLCFLFIAFSASFSSYQPLTLHLSWYVFPLFLPAVLLSANWVGRMTKLKKIIILTVVVLGGIYFSHQYTIYFEKTDNNLFKDYIRQHSTEQIYTDHFTKYSIDLIDSYQLPLRTYPIPSPEFDLQEVNPGSLIVYNHFHVDELISQGHRFPDFEMLKSENFRLEFQSGGFEIYKKLTDSR